MNNDLIIDAVIVTYNRLNKLKIALQSLKEQTMSFRNIIIVNNNSDDGTKEYLESLKEDWEDPKIIIIHTSENLGGSGGFYLGQKKALELKPDWIYIQDDDAYPENDMNEKLKNFLDHNGSKNIAAVCCSVYDSNEKIDLEHRRFFKYKYGFKPQNINSKFSDYELESFKIDVFSYVGTYIRYPYLEDVGLVNRDFFIYWDDTEHSLRLRRKGDIICVPDIKVYHDSGARSTDSNYITWRSYYIIRNQLYTYLSYNKLAGLYYIINFYIRNRNKYGHKGKKLVNQAIKDALLKKMGKNIIYQPPFSISLGE